MTRGPLKNRLRVLRKQPRPGHPKGLTLNDVASTVGIDLSTLSKIENGAPCRDATKIKLAEFYGLPVHEIFLFDPMIAGEVVA